MDVCIFLPSCFASFGERFRDIAGSDVSEYMQLEQLLKMLKRQEPSMRMNERLLAYTLREVLLALQYLHKEQDLVHRLARNARSLHVFSSQLPGRSQSTALEYISLLLSVPNISIALQITDDLAVEWERMESFVHV